MPASPASDERLAAAIALTPAGRMETAAAFFTAHPGSPNGPHGLGQAILDFQAWEISSGRIGNAAGSDWWRAVNGMMVLDMAVAGADDDGTPSPAIAAWRRFATSPASDAQSALWEAHQRSLHAGIRAAAGLLSSEAQPERQFAAIVVDVVDRTAIAGTPTDNDGLARMTERFYPAHYPALSTDLPALEAMRAKTAARLTGDTGQVLVDVGLDSNRWD